METAAFIDEVAQRLVAYLASKDTDVRVNPAASLSTMRKTLDVQLPEGHGLNAVLDDLDTFISNSVKTHRSEFMNPLWGGLSLPAFAGEVVASLTNNSMYTYELSPIATVIEQTISSECLRWSASRWVWYLHHRWLKRKHARHVVRQRALALWLHETWVRRALNCDLRFCRGSLLRTHGGQCDRHWSPEHHQGPVR